MEREVVAGVDRTQARQALLVIAGIGALTSLKYSWGYLIMNVVYGIALSLTHAILRPIDLKSTLSNLWRDVKNVATKEEAAGGGEEGGERDEVLVEQTDDRTSRRPWSSR